MLLSLLKILENNQINLETTQIEKLELFLEMFIVKNKLINLSAIREKNEIILKHLVDSLSILKFQNLQQKKILDIGTGGGFPWIPLAIALPNSKIILLDSTQKKINCVDEFIDKLSLKNTKTFWGRVEEQKKLAKVDFIVIRSVAYIDKLLHWTKKIFLPNTTMILYKTPSLEEIKSLYSLVKPNRVKIIDYQIKNEKEIFNRSFWIINGKN